MLLQTNSRMRFLLEREEAGKRCPAFEQASFNELAADEELCKAAGVSIFPVAIAVAALPALSFLWNLHVVVGKLMPT